MPLIERDHEIQAFSTPCSNQSLAERVRLRGANRRLENRQVHCRECRIDTLRVDRVAVVNHESVRLVARDDHPKLLRGPVSRARRHSNPKLHEERGGNSFLAPGVIRGCHRRDQLVQLRWNRRTSGRARFPTPQ